MFTEAMAYMEVVKAFTRNMSQAEAQQFAKDVREALKNKKWSHEGTLAEVAAQHVKDAVDMFNK